MLISPRRSQLLNNCYGLCNVVVTDSFVASARNLDRTEIFLSVVSVSIDDVTIQTPPLLCSFSRSGILSVNDRLLGLKRLDDILLEVLQTSLALANIDLCYVLYLFRDVS